MKLRRKDTLTSTIPRRDFLRIAGAGTAALAVQGVNTLGLQAQAAKQKDYVEIKFDVNWRTGRWYFDPAGLYLKRGQKVRWVCKILGGSATAFHPANDNHELRIPEKARPFDSGFMVDRDLPGSWLEYLFEEEGTYDFFSRSHERIGAIGRIIVDAPGGPGEKPLGYGGSEGRAPIFKDARKLHTWLTSERIVREKVVPYPIDLMQQAFPAHDSRF